jgi:hypothetical protein
MEKSETSNQETENKGDKVKNGKRSLGDRIMLDRSGLVFQVNLILTCSQRHNMYIT